MNIFNNFRIVTASLSLFSLLAIGLAMQTHGVERHLYQESDLPVVIHHQYQASDYWQTSQPTQQNKNNRPGRQGPPGRGPQNRPPNQPQHHGDIAQTRKVLAKYAQEITNLTTLYSTEISRKPELRASIGECFQLRAQVITLSQASQQTKQTEVDPIIWTTGGFCLERKNHAI